ncbi:hypothetical protein [Streptomyces sp. 3N207]|uniref:hypothetical protein n=1 Tax=Streptomyces sp. 3N207 TaxID=3457417 RepID=UPI003FD5276D
MPAVLVLGFDPHTVPGVDGYALHAALDEELARFAELSVDASVAVVAAHGPDESVFRTALSEREWDVVVIGGGIRKPEPALLFFERVVNLVHRHAPGAAIAFNTSIGDSVEAARRWLPSVPSS